jgi:hypothetical protein
MPALGGFGSYRALNVSPGTLAARRPAISSHSSANEGRTWKINTTNAAMSRADDVMSQSAKWMIGTRNIGIDGSEGSNLVKSLWLARRPQ